jgi:PAS domain S-box-containing protein
MEKMKGFKILVVDDTPELLDINKRILTKAGYTVFSAVNGAECLKALKDNRPDILLLDIRLPDISGKDICKKVKNDPELSSVFIILISSLKTHSVDISEGFEGGADGYIIRPVEDRELIARIEAACRIIAAERELEESDLKWRTTFDGIKDSVLVLDSEGIIIQVNKSATQLLGKTEKEMLGHYCYEIVQTSKDFKEDCPFVRMKKSRKRETMVLPMGEKWVDITVDPIIDETGALNGAVHFISDITERKLDEESLIKDQRLLSESQSIARLGSFVWDISSGFWKSSDILDEIFGISENYARTFEGWVNIVHPDWRSVMIDYVTNDILGKFQKFDKEYQIIRQTDGQPRWVHGISELEFDNNKKPKILIGTIIDITSRKLTEIALIESEERFRSLFENSTIGIYRTTPDGKILLANPTLVKILGYSDFNELAERNLDEKGFEPSYDRNLFIDMMNRDNEVVGLESSWVRKDGVRIYVRESAHAFRDKDGRVLYYDGTVEDITERKMAENALEERTKELVKELEERKSAEKELKESHNQLETSKKAALNLLEDIKTEMSQRQKAEELIRRRSEELRLSEEKFKNVFEFASVGKSMTSLRGNIHPNKAFCQMLGYTKKEMKDADWRELTHPDDIKKNDEITTSILRGEKRSARWEKRYLRKNGEVIWVDITTTLQRDANGQPLYFITTVIDITERKRAEEKINQLNSELEKRVMERTYQLEEANKELQAFAYSVSHDLRAPLRAINGFSEFIVDDYGSKIDDEGRRLLGLIRSNTQKMDQLITDILSLSRVTRGEHRLSKVDMTKMAFSMLNEVVSPEALEKIVVKIGIMPETYADSTFIKQVWINLISNAVKFSSGKKRPEIKIGGYCENEFNIYFVKDNGVGFDPEYSSKLFGVFQRLHKASEFEGTGVGLAIVQRIVHRHGGKVWAEGKVGKGAAFYFSLPVKNNGESMS